MPKIPGSSELADRYARELKRTPPCHWVTNREFLETLFGEAWGWVHVCGFPGDPRTAPDCVWAGWPAREAVERLNPYHNNYYTVSRFSGPRRRRNSFIGMHVLLLDDVGTAMSGDSVLDLMDGVLPTYELETSPGNAQWGYRLTPPQMDLERIERVQLGLVKRLTRDGVDPGQRNVTRYGRLPLGRNHKPVYVGKASGKNPDGFECRLQAWRPGR